jgi:hypothetical protein
MELSRVVDIDPAELAAVLARDSQAQESGAPTTSEDRAG